MVQGNTVRPLPSTLSSTSTIVSKERRKPTTVAWLWSACAFLLVLCALLLAALIAVARRASFAPEHHHIQDDPLVSGNQLLPAGNNNSKSVIVLPNQSPQDYKLGGRPVVGGDQVNPVSADDIMARRFANELTFRLQSEIKPLLYKLEFFPDLLNTKKFNGTVEIDLDVLSPVNYIAIHSKQLQISNTSLQVIKNSGQVGDPVKIANSYVFDKFEYWVTEFNDSIDAGRYKMALSFDGSLTDRIVGFYASSYFSPAKNATRAIATTKFEPTYARQAFPCFDEPDKKAQFDISIIRPTGDDYLALSNMNEMSSTDLDGGVTRTTFNRSVPMSTYLAAFIVCDFSKKAAVIESSGIGQNVELRVFATPHQLNKVDVALDAAKKITEFYIRYFNLAYPLPKLDLIAIPDFVSGAMEHWGLLTFRETAMLYEKGVSSSRNKQRVVTVIAHELAHQWFGNLVTMEFWNDLWLNEGFASYIEYMGTEVVHADWGMREQFLVDDFYRVISIDASLGTHPIVQNVSSPDQITEIFDAITYSKGATVIRMLEDIIGAENFKTAVSSYLDKFKYGNAITEDFLNEIESLELGIDIKVIMDTWTLQGGVPVVNVQRTGDGQYTLTQKRFFSNPANENAELPPSIFNYRWYIPVTYFTDVSRNVSRTWFPHTDSQLKVEVGDKHKWIKFNKDQMGYFLVNYAPDMWAALSAALKEDLNSFSVSDRVQLLNDAFLLAEATQLDYKVPMELTAYLVKETQYVPWSVAIGNLHSIRKLIYREPVVAQLQKYGLRMLENIYKDLGWEVNEEEHQKNLLRSEVLSFACSLKHEKCLARSKEEFLKWLDNPAVRPHPDIRTVVYNYGMEVAGNETTWQQVWELFLQELDAQEKVKLMGSLARVQDPSILGRFIKLAWDEKNVRRQDYFNCLAMISNNRVGEPLVWDYVRSHWEEMVNRFGLNERYLGSLIPSITDAFTTEMRLQEIKDFFAKYPDAGAGARSRVMALETVQKNIKWKASNLQPLSEWLNANA